MTTEEFKDRALAFARKYPMNSTVIADSFEMAMDEISGGESIESEWDLFDNEMFVITGVHP